MATFREELNAQALNYIRAHAINARSISREHLAYLVDGLRVPMANVAELLGIPRWLMARKARRLGFHNRPRVQDEAALLEVSQDHLPEPASASIHPQANGDQLHTEEHQESERHIISHADNKYATAYAEAKAYVAGLDGQRQRIPNADDLHYLYHDLQLPLEQIAQLYGRVRQTVLIWMKQARLVRRTSAETKTIYYNATFFRQWSPAMAWVLGLIYTDGNLSKTNVTLSSIDRELLEKVQVLVAPRKMIHTQRQARDQNKTIDTFQIAHQRMVTDLRQIGLQERKSLIMTFPDVPPDCTRHFIRGCWDGDGGFTESAGRLSAHYTCGSRKFIARLAVELLRAGIGRKTLGPKDYGTIENVRRLRAKYRKGPYPLNLYKHRNASAYQLTITSLHALEKLYDFFYKDVDPAIYMSRKHEIIKRHLSFVRKERA